MKLVLKRKYFTQKSTIGELYVDDKYFCDTLEDYDRFLESGGVKIAGKTAIPRGEYQVKMTMSARFGRVLPLLLDVPQFTGIRFHSGNTDNDTEGCILVGTKTSDDYIINSRKASDALNVLIANAIERGDDVTIEVT